MIHFSWWLLPDSNWGHTELQSDALPTELKSQLNLPSNFTLQSDFLQGLRAIMTSRQLSELIDSMNLHPSICLLSIDRYRVLFYQDPI